MTRGQLHLQAEVAKRAKKGLSQNDCAALVGCDTGNFSKILHKGRLPGRALSSRIKKVFGTKPEWFDEEASEQRGTAA